MAIGGPMYGDSMLATKSQFNDVQPEMPLEQRLNQLVVKLTDLHEQLNTFEDTPQAASLNGPQPSFGVFMAARQADDLASSLLVRFNHIRQRVGRL